MRPNTPKCWLTDALRARLRRLHGDESGSAMTEFIVILPVFVLVFVGVVHLAKLNRATVRAGGKAYEEMWDKAIEVQVDSPGIHAQPQSAGSDVMANMGTYHGLQEDRSMQQIVRHETTDMGRGLSSNGSMGESFQRVERARNDIELRHIDGDVTSDIGGVVEDSRYARKLFDDSGGAQLSYTSSSGGSGIRPVVAAGQQYGSVVGKAEETVTLGGRDFKMQHYYTTLVAPHWRDEPDAAGVTRDALDGLQPYDNLLGIAEDQPLRNETIDVREIEGIFPLPDNQNSPGQP